MSALTNRRGMAAATIGVALLAIALYSPSLSLPVIYDDLLHIRIAESLNPISVWLPTEQFGFYRPLTFVPLLIIKWLFGHYPNWLLHGLSVTQHGLNAILLITLTWRVFRNEATALVSGILFAFFPFSYQAIAVYGHNVHPTTTGLILLGMHTYLSAIQAKGHRNRVNGERNGNRPRLIWYGLTGLIFLLSLLSHESAVLFGALAALVEWNVNRQLLLRKRPFDSVSLRRLPPWAIFLLLGITYAVVYRFLPLTRALPGASGEGGGLWNRVLYVLQAAAYPFTWTAHRLPDIEASSLILGSVFITGLLTLWTGRKRENRLPLFLGWGWWTLAMLVVVIPLPTGYVLHGPRLLYLGSVGLAWAWATILTNQKSGVGKYIWLLGGTAFILVTNWQFVRGRLADYARLTEPVEVIPAVMVEQPEDQGIVVVNLPQWISPTRNIYAAGAELVAMLGDHLFADEIVVANLREKRPVYSVVSPDLLRSTDYAYNVHDETMFRGEAAATLPVRSDWEMAGSQVFIVNYEQAGPKTTHVGAFQPAPDGGAPLAYLGPYDLIEASGTLCDGTVQVTLVWKQSRSEPVPPTLSMFVQLLADGAPPVAQADGPPLGLRPDLIRLLPDWQITDLRTLQPVGEGTPSRLLIGAYDFVSGERFPAFDDHRMPLVDNAYRIELMPCG